MKYSEVKDNVSALLNNISQDLSDLDAELESYTDDNPPDIDTVSDWIARVQLFYSELQSVYNWLRQYSNTL